MSAENLDQVLVAVADTIRTTIAEDWVDDFDIGRETRFSEDLEMESIEFVKLADALQARFGEDIDLVGWLSGKSIHELIQLNVGQIADFIATH